MMNGYIQRSRQIRARSDERRAYLGLVTGVASCRTIAIEPPIREALLHYCTPVNALL